MPNGVFDLSDCRDSEGASDPHQAVPKTTNAATGVNQAILYRVWGDIVPINRTRLQSGLTAINLTT